MPSDAPRIPRGYRALGIAAVPLVLVIGAAAWADQQGWLFQWAPWLYPPALTHVGEGRYGGRLIRVVDGDTVDVRYHDMRLRLRLRNLDTEESVHPDAERNTAFGRETSDWAQRRLDGRRVWVEFLRDRDGMIDTDHHGRALAFVWLDNGDEGPSDDDVCYNVEAVREGYSAYITEYGTSPRYHQDFVVAEAEARAEGRGIWADDHPQPTE